MVLIGSAGSSGSTVFSNLINRHPDIICGDELSIFSKHQFYNNFDKIQKNWILAYLFGLSDKPYDDYHLVMLSGFKRYDGLTRIKAWKLFREASSFKEFVEKIEKHISEITGKKIWVEKSPQNIRTIKEARLLWPELKYIHIIRDPRDVIQSFEKKGRTMYEAAEQWLTSVSSIQAYRNDKNVLEIRYEDLVSKPEVVLKKVSKFLGIKYDINYFTKDKYLSKGIQRGNFNPTWNLKPGEALSTSSIGKYKDSELNLKSIMNMKISTEYSKATGFGIFSIDELAKSYGYNTNDTPGIKKFAEKKRRNFLFQKILQPIYSIYENTNDLEKTTL